LRSSTPRLLAELVSIMQNSNSDAARGVSAKTSRRLGRSCRGTFAAQTKQSNERHIVIAGFALALS
jgi:hypothetical protein